MHVSKDRNGGVYSVLIRVTAEPQKAISYYFSFLHKKPAMTAGSDSYGFLD